MVCDNLAALYRLIENYRLQIVFYYVNTSSFTIIFYFMKLNKAIYDIIAFYAIVMINHSK